MVLEMTSGGKMLWPMLASKIMASMLSSVDGVQMATLWLVATGTMLR